MKPREFDGYLSAFERRPPRVIVVAGQPPTPRSREWRPSYVLRFERSVLSRYRPYRSVASTKGRRWIVMTQARG